MNYNVEVFEPSGTLDELNGRNLRNEINKSIKNGANIILIDLTNVIFMDSSGLAALALVRKTVRVSGGKLFLASLSKSVKMLFDLTAVDRLFEIFADRDEFSKTFVSHQDSVVM